MFFDDVSYSGLQIDDTIRLNYFNTFPNFTLYLTVPFISNNAKFIIASNKNFIKFWSNSVIISDLRTEFLNGINEKDYEKYRYIYNSFCGFGGEREPGFQCQYTQIPIYFDHKIADSVSTLNKLLYFGTYPIEESNILQNPYTLEYYRCQPKCILTSLINNCDSNMCISITGVQKSDYCSKKIIDPPYNKICPQTFYKFIKYSFPSPPYPSYEEIIKHITDNQQKITLMTLLNFYNTQTTVFSPRISKSLRASAVKKYENLEYKQKYNKYKQKYLELKKVLNNS